MQKAYTYKQTLDQTLVNNDWNKDYAIMGATCNDNEG